MKALRYTLATVVCALCVSLISCEARAISFDTGSPGGLPPGWRTGDSGESRWEILPDRTAPSRPYVLAQLSPAPRGILPLALLESEEFTDGSISVRFKPVAGKEDRSGGLVWRYRDSGNYYLAVANAMANNLSVWKVVEGKPAPVVPRGKPDQPPVVERRVPSESWSTLKVKFRGPRFQVYFNHRQLLEVEDATFPGPGKVGLLTQADSVTYFDDFRLERRR